MANNGKTDLSSPRSSAVSRMTANIEKNGRVVTSIDDFYRKLKADKAGANKKKGEAVKSLHEFRGKSAENMTKKESIRNPVAVQQHHEFTPDYEMAEKSKAAEMNLPRYSGLSFNSLRSKSGESPNPNGRAGQKEANTTRQKDYPEVQDLTIETGKMNVDEIEGIRLDAGKVDNSSETQDKRVLVDFKKHDYRGFIFALHEQHGLLMLHCTRKKKKGPHHQLPGGHIDESEFLMAAENCQDAHAQLAMAAQAGAARELYEETGIDVRSEAYRLEPAALRNDTDMDEHGELVMTCEVEKRLYFFLQLKDEDFQQDSDPENNNNANLVAPMSEIGSNLRLKLSVEHSGFEFEKDPEKAAELLKQHSGGKGSKALLMAVHREKKDKFTLNEEECRDECDTATSLSRQESEGLQNNIVTQADKSKSGEILNSNRETYASAAGQKETNTTGQKDYPEVQALTIDTAKMNIDEIEGIRLDAGKFDNTAESDDLDDALRNDGLGYTKMKDREMQTSNIVIGRGKGDTAKPKMAKSSLNITPTSDGKRFLKINSTKSEVARRSAASISSSDVNTNRKSYIASNVATPKAARSSVKSTPSSNGAKKNRSVSTQACKSNSPASVYSSSSPAYVYRRPNATAEKICDKHWIIDLHGTRSGCERCLSLSSPEDRRKFAAEGRHYRINRVRGGCARSCKIFPRAENDQPVRLCRKCFYDTHYHGGK